jgi:acetylornithine deacetylase/succinyl-diaminopimelate desuccinylase-like protein
MTATLPRNTGQGTRDLKELTKDLCRHISAERLIRRTMQLVLVPSPSGQEVDVADVYAGILRSIGLETILDREFPESPSVIARWDGTAEGQTLQLDGHLDTVATPHAKPEVHGHAICARGACDMKGGLAVITEVAQILSESGLPLRGSLLTTAHGQHEEAVNGHPLHAPLLGLLRRGIHGDACIIPEGPHDELPIAGRGLIIFSVRFSRPGEPVHEILGHTGPVPNPIMAATRFVHLFERRARHWNIHDELAGPESFFIGSIHGGDLYNRVPTSAEVTGTRRYPVPVTYETAREELEEIAGVAANEFGVGMEVVAERSGQPFSVSPTEPIVGALSRSHDNVIGRPLPLTGMRYSGDVSQFVNVAGVPALYHGTDQTTAHSDRESVAVGALVRCASVLLGAALEYLMADHDMRI